ncbi:MAG: RNA polymerase sigma factor [Candidatus Wallbacteria bacterium]|nr:RNA polymerase sigma factor [Candidatus Wallbacteria bacterium]
MEEVRNQNMAEPNHETVFKQIYLRHYREIFLYCYHLTADREESLDIAQDVFCKAYDEQRIGSPDFKVRPWLYRVARNECLLFFRKVRRWLREKTAYSLLSESAEPSRDEEFLKINALLSRMPARYKSILYLKYFEEMSYEEIAESEEIPLGTVMSRLSRAKSIFKEVMEHGTL